MSDLLTTDLGKVAGAVSDAGPALVVLDDNGEPSYPVAYKGKHAVDFVHVAGVGAAGGPIKQAQTDRAPALAAMPVASGTALCLAWKVAGETTVQVLQRALTDGSDWADLPLADGGAPLAAQTDAAPALCVGADGVLYMAWKAPGASGYLLLSGYDGQGWSPPEVYTAAVTDQGPALAGWLTSGPGSARPMCLAWKEAGHSDVLWSFFTPGGGGLSPNRAPGGVSTQAAPALCTAPSDNADTFYLAWTPEKGGAISFAPVTREAMGAVLTLPQAQTNDAPAIGNWSNSTSGFGAQVFNDLIVGFTAARRTTCGAAAGRWSPIRRRAPPGAWRAAPTISSARATGARR